MYKEAAKNKIKQHADAEKLILTFMYTWHMGSRWYKSEHKIVTTDILTFVPLWHQSLYLGIEGISVEGL
jgi:hypothetical protein